MAIKLITERFILFLGIFISSVILFHSAGTKILHEVFNLNYLNASCSSGLILLIIFYAIAKFNRRLEKQISNFLYFKGKEHYALLLKEAITDGLTGLYDHKYLMLKIEEEVERSKRYLRPLSFLMIDVDNFKRYNDTFGHPAGDGVLVEVASMLKRFARKTDLAARYGGEEFAVILPETRKESALKVAEVIRKEIAGLEFNGNQKITVSMGLGFFEGAEPKFVKEDLIRMADEALYRAKNNGKNRIEI